MTLRKPLWQNNITPNRDVVKKRVIILVFLGMHSSYACLGARPLGMGGAFVAVADDVHACYWNPAGIANIRNKEFTTMFTMNNRDIINYQEWLGGASKIPQVGGIGFSYVHSIMWTYERAGYDKYYVFDAKWKVLSIGSYGTGIFKNSACGINIRQIDYNLMTGFLPFFQGRANFKKTRYKTNSLGCDIGILHKVNENFTLGLLIQDVNRPTINFGKDAPIKREYRWARNIRPGLAWRPDDKTIFALDLYNLTLDDVYDVDKEGQTQVRIGVERYIIDGLAIRAGLYGKAFHTIGLGIRSQQASSVKNMELKLDYALMESYLAGTHLLSLNISW